MRSFSTFFKLWLAGSAAAVTIDMEGLPDTGLDTSSWTTGTLPPISDCVDINDLQIAAKNTLSPANYAYYRTAALDEISELQVLLAVPRGAAILTYHSIPSQSFHLAEDSLEWIQLRRCC